MTSGGGGVEFPEPGQTAIEVPDLRTGEPAKYPGNNKPIIPNIKGAKRVGRTIGISGALQIISDVLSCVQNVASK